ncbi:hypothetical protein [Rhizobium sp. EC-SD404]|uniref:hypothetical protein n=1 Tax=Rhizobium sp. EC-SD404 TaxID=2038389 RepID=UPI001259C1B8|nr:hypothetical protein [Rhizobium sp. EC-SD404]VVT16955.1 conserved hypothetical protein [Rhizobium sp. EC-SD404]
MPLQNRVDPFGSIHAHPARGLFMGNRGGRIHDPATRTLTKRRFASRAWIICLCDFKGRRRIVMGESYTELFFLDEATALASGHRPCFECQRARAIEFSRCFAAGNGLAAMKAPEIDALLHSERLDANVRRRLPMRDLHCLPDGSFLDVSGRACLVLGGKLLGWSFDGYHDDPAPRASDGVILTPPSTLRALEAGYRPVIHPSGLSHGT